MMRIGVVGINHKLAGLKLRESFATICQQRFCPERSMHHQHTLVLLSTCNRTEVYFSSENLTDCHSYIINILRKDLQNIEETFDQKLYSYFGLDCFSHLARVTAGLDSAIVAETEIQGQVKQAYEHALNYLSMPKEIHFLFQKALKIGKRVRTHLPLGRGVPDLEHAILHRGYQTFGEPETSTILIVGASEINQKIVSFLTHKHFKHITITNRSPAPAQLIAEKYRLKQLDWERLGEWTAFDWIIVGTRFSGYLISKKNLSQTQMSHKLIIDLCVPRNVEPKLCRHPAITLLNIDQMNSTLSMRKQRMTHVLNQAECLVYAESKKQMHLFQQKEHKREQLIAVS
ncbi:MAG: glutamyl-tRNA reductase [Waddliaceae bacterium]